MHVIVAYVHYIRHTVAYIFLFHFVCWPIRYLSIHLFGGLHLPVRTIHMCVPDVDLHVLERTWNCRICVLFFAYLFGH